MPVRTMHCCDVENRRHRVMLTEEQLFFLKVQAEWLGCHEQDQRKRQLWESLAEHCTKHLAHHAEADLAEVIARERAIRSEQNKATYRKRKSA